MIIAIRVDNRKALMLSLDLKTKVWSAADFSHQTAVEGKSSVLADKMNAAHFFARGSKPPSWRAEPHEQSPRQAIHLQNSDRKSLSKFAGFASRGSNCAGVEPMIEVPQLEPAGKKAGREVCAQQEEPMAWTTPTIVEICVGMEITAYESAEI